MAEGEDGLVWQLHRVIEPAGAGQLIGLERGPLDPAIDDPGLPGRKLFAPLGKRLLGTFIDPPQVGMQAVEFLALLGGAHP